MTDDRKQYATMIAATLEAHIIDSRLPKSETEWWAHREILRLRAENEKLRALLKDLIEDHEYMTDTDAEEDNMARAAARAALKEKVDE